MCKDCNCAPNCASTCKTKPFDPTKPVQTRDGRKARIICTDSNYTFESNKKWPTLALVTNKSNGNELVMYFEADGTCGGAQRGGVNDLVNIPEQVFRYVNIHRQDVIDQRKNGLIAVSRVRDNPCSEFLTLKLTFEDDKLVASEVIR